MFRTVASTVAKRSHCPWTKSSQLSKAACSPAKSCLGATLASGFSEPCISKRIRSFLAFIFRLRCAYAAQFDSCVTCGHRHERFHLLYEQGEPVCSEFCRMELLVRLCAGQAW